MYRLQRSETNLIVVKVLVQRDENGAYPEKHYTIQCYHTTTWKWSSRFFTYMVKEKFLKSEEFRNELFNIANRYRDKYGVVPNIEIKQCYADRSMWFPQYNYYSDPLSYYEKLGYEKFMNVVTLEEEDL